MSMQGRLGCLLVLLLASAGCAPKVFKSERLPEMGVKLLAVLPSEYPSNIQRERVDYLRNQLLAELRSSNFPVLEDSLVQQVCSTPACAEREKLFTQYGVDTVAELQLDSIARNEFLAGFLHVIRGKLTLRNAAHEELIRVEHAQTQKGGLLFNSGQLFQGFISQAKSLKDTRKDVLAEKFVAALVAKLPPAQGKNIDAKLLALKIDDVDVTPRAPRVYEVCGTASPGMMAYLVVGRQKSNLREITEGRYCGAYFLGEGTSKPVFELRSSIGSAVRKEVVLADASSCDLSGKVSVRPRGGERVVNLPCLLGKEGVQGQYVIYRSFSPVGPFQKVGQTRMTQWVDVKAMSVKEVFYQVVFVGKDGTFSRPEAARVEEGAISTNTAQMQA